MEGRPESFLRSLTIEKGGTSVAVDGYLVSGTLGEEPLHALFGYGVVLQFIDDLQDIPADDAAGHSTMFTRAGRSGPLDESTEKLIHFTARTIRQLGHRPPGGTRSLAVLIEGSCLFLSLKRLRGTVTCTQTLFSHVSRNILRSGLGTSVVFMTGSKPHLPSGRILCFPPEALLSCSPCCISRGSRSTRTSTFRGIVLMHRIPCFCSSSCWPVRPRRRAAPAAYRQEPLSSGIPEISGSQISPDGRFITFLKPYRGVRNIWLKTVAEPFDRARPITADTMRPVTGYFWSFDSRHVIYVQDKEGDENYRIYAVDPEAPGSPVPPARDLTPLAKIRADVIAYAAVNPRRNPDRTERQAA